MKEEIVTDVSLRQFLLGGVDDEERVRIESLVITNAVTKERVCAAEEDLLEDYFEDALSGLDRESFLTQYAYNSQQQRRLQITRDIRNWAVAAQKRKETSSVTQTSSRSSVFTSFRLKPMLVVPIAATVVAIVMVGLWLNRNMELRNRQLATEKEIGRLNASTSNPDERSSSLTLRPVTLRGAETQTELVRRPDIQIVELRLLWNLSESYPSYQARLKRTGDTQSFVVHNLHAEIDGKAILLRLPNQILTVGTYQVELTSIMADGQSGPTEEFQFSVAR
jgi:hypothetical protein